MKTSFWESSWLPYKKNQNFRGKLSFGPRTKTTATKGKPRASSIIPEPVTFGPSQHKRTSNNSQSTKYSVAPVPGSRIKANLAERGRSPVRRKTQQRVDSNLENQTRRQQSLPASTGRSSISTSPVGQKDHSVDSLGLQNDPIDRTPVPSEQNPVASNSNSHAATQNQTPISPSIVIMPMDKSKLPATYGHKAPTFDGRESEDLERYLDTVEDIIEVTKATSNGEKKWIALRYCTTATRREWAALPHHEDEYTWEQFKDQILKNYPESRESKEGSIALLDKLVRRYYTKKVPMDDVGDFMSFIRQFRAEAEKLLYPNLRVSNRELATRLLACLDPDLVKDIKSRLYNTDKDKLGSTLDRKKAEDAIAKGGKMEDKKAYKALLGWRSDRDDKYFWSDLLDTATELVENEAVSFYDTEAAKAQSRRGPVKAVLFGSEEQPSANTKLDDRFSALEQAMAQGLDKVQTASRNQLKEFESVLKKFSENSVRPPAPAPEAPPRWGNPSRPYSDNPRPPPQSRDCFHCGQPGHFISECQKRRDDIDNGIIKVVDGRTCFYDGRPIPRQPGNKCTSLKAEEYKARQTMNQNLQSQELLDQYLYEEDDPGYDPREDEIRTLKVEAEALKQLLQSQSEASRRPANSSRSSYRPTSILKPQKTAYEQHLASQMEDEREEQFTQTRTGAGEPESDDEGFR